MRHRSAVQLSSQVAAAASGVGSSPSTLANIGVKAVTTPQEVSSVWSVINLRYTMLCGSGAPGNAQSTHYSFDERTMVVAVSIPSKCALYTECSHWCMMEKMFPLAMEGMS